MKLFIAIHYMELGGAERALLGLLEALAQTDIDIDLFVYSHRGPLMDVLPDKVHLLPEDPVYAHLESPLRETLRSGHVALAVARLCAKIANRIHNSHLQGESASILDEVGRATVRVLPDLSSLGTYDIAISFLTPHYIVRDKVRAHKKLAWIHTDYSVVQINARREAEVWASYDRIVSISDGVTQAFLKVFPELESKIYLQENFLPVQLINRQAEEFDASCEMPGSIRLLSIGRFCTPKNFPGAVDIMAELCRIRDDVRWYIIGFGSDEHLIRERIAYHHLEDKFIILGQKSNPYPYIKACDLYVQPSIYEGKAVTVKEAQFLGKPVVITRYPTAPSQLQDGVDGLIVPLDPPSAAQAIDRLLHQPEQLAELARNAQGQRQDIDVAALFA